VETKLSTRRRERRSISATNRPSIASWKALPTFEHERCSLKPGHRLLDLAVHLAEYAGDQVSAELHASPRSGARGRGGRREAQPCARLSRWGALRRWGGMLAAMQTHVPRALCARTQRGR